MTTASSRWLDLEGAANARDLGGLPLEGGGATASGVLVRSDNLQGLTPADVRRLVDDLGVAVVVDLRTGAEVALEGPGPLVAEGRVEIRHRSLYPEAGGHTDAAADETVFPWVAARGRTREETPAVRAYLGYLRDRPDSILGALRDIARAPGATVVHCAAGKDRTGVVCMLALAVAGATREAIVADFLATGERIAALMARLRASPTYADDLRHRDDAAHAPRPETIERVLDVLEARHGGPLGWLAQARFAGDDAAALRRRLRGE
ncbi:MAG TPA: tyrosine-protein phosphatase [Solirubrobacteraceae bacterium]|nr:tyrosine-protein phosphatase [Solirubrobacteraceae bacterium]